MERSTRELCLNFTVVLITVILIWLLVRSYQYWDTTAPGIDCNTPELSSVCAEIPLLSWDAFSGTPQHFWPVRTIFGLPPVLGLIVWSLKMLLSMAAKCLPGSIRFIPQLLLQMCQTSHKVKNKLDSWWHRILTSAWCVSPHIPSSHTQQPNSKSTARRKKLLKEVFVSSYSYHVNKVVNPQKWLLEFILPSICDTAFDPWLGLKWQILQYF